MSKKIALQQVVKTQLLIVGYHEAKINSAKEEMKEAFYDYLKELIRRDKRIRGFVSGQGSWEFLNWNPAIGSEATYGSWMQGVQGGIPKWLKPHIAFVEKFYESLNQGPGYDYVWLEREKDSDVITRKNHW